MHSYLYKVALVRNNSSELVCSHSFDGTCSCFSYAENQNCEHENAVLGTTSNRIVINNSAARIFDALEELDSAESYECIRIPSKTKSNVVLCLTFHRKMLSLTFQIMW